MSNFDPATFLDQSTTEQSLRRPPLPAGDYQATITDLSSRTWQGKPGGKAEGKSGIAFDVKLRVSTSPDLQAAGQPPEITLNDSIMVDLTDAGLIDYGIGKSGRLRIYREATGLNAAGQPFSPRQLVGRLVTAKLKQREYQGEFFEEVDSVAKA